MPLAKPSSSRRSIDRALGTDAQLRALVSARVRRAHPAAADAVLVSELGVLQGRARADLAFVNGHLHGFEVKSEQDSLRRLPGQVSAFSRVFDRATLVTTDTHLIRASKIVPSWWEILVLTSLKGTPALVRHRRGKPNPSVNLRSVVELLWYDDAIALLRMHDAERGALRKPREFLWNRICEVVPEKAVKKFVLKTLKSRPTLRSARRS